MNNAAKHKCLNFMNSYEGQGGEINSVCMYVFNTKATVNRYNKYDC